MLKKLFAGSDFGSSTKNQYIRPQTNRQIFKSQHTVDQKRESVTAQTVQTPLQKAFSNSSQTSKSSTQHYSSSQQTYASSLDSTTSSPSICPPVSVIDEADTRNLLYGATNIESSGIAKIDGLKDIRVVILGDISRLDVPFYDTAFNSSDYPLSSHVSSGSVPSQQQRRSSLPSYSPPNLQAYLKYAAEIPSFTNLQTRVFGHSYMRYNGPVTKLHPLPFAEVQLHNDRSDGNNSSVNNNNKVSEGCIGANPNLSNSSEPSHSSPKRVWLVSRVFRLSQNDKSLSMSTTCASTPSDVASSSLNYLIKDSFAKRFSFGTDKPDLKNSSTNASPKNHSLNQYNNNPRISSVSTLSNTHFPTNKKTPSNSSQDSNTSDYLVAICLFITVPQESQSDITNYWEELTAALLQLQVTVSKELLSNLPLFSREFTPAPYSDSFQNTGPLSTGIKISQRFAANQSVSHQHQLNNSCSSRRSFYRYTLNGNFKIKNAIETFRARFLVSVRVPRVICGQEKWSELVGIFKWALTSFGPNSEK